MKKTGRGKGGERGGGKRSKRGRGGDRKGAGRLRAGRGGRQGGYGPDPSRGTGSGTGRDGTGFFKLFLKKPILQKFSFPNLIKLG